MSVIAAGAGVDHWASATLPNGDFALVRASASILTSEGLVFGSELYRCDPRTGKSDSRVSMSMYAAPTAELALAYMWEPRFVNSAGTLMDNATGTATSTTATTMVHTGAGWTASLYIDCVVYCGGSVGAITANTTDTLTLTWTGGTPAAGAYTISFRPPTLASRMFGSDPTAGQRIEMKIAANGSSTSSVLGRFFYDGTQIGADQTITVSKASARKKYRVAVYVKLGTLATGDSTYKVYIDDVTSGMTDTFSATNVISTNTANFARTPAFTGMLEPGLASGGTSTGGFIHHFSHLWCIDTTTGGTATDPVNRVLQPIVCSKKSKAVTVDASFNDWATGGATDVADDTSGPDDATTVITTTQNTGGADRTTLWTITPWATVGYSNGDELLAVRTSMRIIGGAGGAEGTSGIKGIHREGGTNVLNSTYQIVAIWTTLPAGRAGGTIIAIQDTPAGTGGNWSPTLYDAVEMGCVAHDSGFIGTGSHPKLTWMRTDAVFLMKAAVVTSTDSRQPALMGMSGGII